MLLRKQVDDDNWDHGDQAACHQHIVLGIVLAVQCGQGDGQGHLGPVGQHQQRPEVVVPGLHKSGHCQRRQGRRAQRQGHPGIDLENVCPIHPCGVQIVRRYGTHLLNQHENCKGAEEGGEDHTGIAVDQAQPIHDHKERDHGHLCGDHHGGQVQAKQLPGA